MLYYDPMEYLNRPIGLALILGGAATIVFNIYRALRFPAAARA